MKAAEIFDQIGHQIATHYKALSFKYSKKWGVKKTTDEYEYSIRFHSAEGNSKTKIALFTTFVISCKTVKSDWNTATGLISISLWDLGYYYEIGEIYSLEQAYTDICRHAEVLFIPFIDVFENHANAHLGEWIEQGFLGKIPNDLYRYPHLDYTTHKHYWAGSKFLAEHNEFGFTISLRYILEKFGQHPAEKCLNNYYQSLNDESKRYFSQAYQAEKISTTQPWDCDDQHRPDVEIVKYAVKQGLTLNISSSKG